MAACTRSAPAHRELAVPDTEDLQTPHLQLSDHLGSSSTVASAHEVVGMMGLILLGELLAVGLLDLDPCGIRVECLARHFVKKKSGLREAFTKWPSGS